MLTSDACLRMLAYSKASLLLSLEGLTQDDLLWQPGPGKNSIGWNACHVAHYRGAMMWYFDKEPDWESLGPLLAFGYDSDPDTLRDAIPAKARIIELIHEDWLWLLPRFAAFTEDDFERELSLNNPDGETLFEMWHRVSWHVDYHVGRICGLRSMLGKPKFPRPTFGDRARRNITKQSESRWERVLQAIDES